MAADSFHSPRQRLIVLGSTGSIGVSTLNVVDHLQAQHLQRFDVVGLAAGSNAHLLAQQARQLAVRHLALADPQAECPPLSGTTIHRGPDAALRLIDSIAQRGDLVVAAIVGAAGIPAIIQAIERGCDIALANKETLVAAGAIVVRKAAEHGVNLLPVDSEHSAIFQCLQDGHAQQHPAAETTVRAAARAKDEPSRESGAPPPARPDIARIILTASGGPFRTWPQPQIERATVEQALNHPTWNMGPKVTIDSASLMNKALEIIEAHWLFGLPPEKIDVIIHPQSLIHGLVEFVDGSVMAQLGPPDMKTPIQYALTWPQRAAGVSRRMNWSDLRRMDFEPVDAARFRAPSLAYQVIGAGGTAGAIFNAANEAAVMAFLERRITFGRIIELVGDALDMIAPRPVHTIDDVLEADRAARAQVQRRLAAAPAGSPLHA